MTTTNSFIKQFVALLNGDNGEVKAQKQWRQAQSGLKSQISSLEGDTVNFEDKVTEATENQEKARVNFGSDITNREQYVKNLIDAKNKVVDAEEALEKHRQKIQFLKEELELLQKED